MHPARAAASRTGNLPGEDPRPAARTARHLPRSRIAPAGTAAFRAGILLGDGSLPFAGGAGHPGRPQADHYEDRRTTGRRVSGRWFLVADPARRGPFAVILARAYLEPQAAQDGRCFLAGHADHRGNRHRGLFVGSGACFRDIRGNGRRKSAAVIRLHGLLHRGLFARKRKAATPASHDGEERQDEHQQSTVQQGRSSTVPQLVTSKRHLSKQSRR